MDLAFVYPGASLTILLLKLEEDLFLTIQEGSSEGWLWEMGETKMDQKQEHDVINSQPISTVALAL